MGSLWDSRNVGLGFGKKMFPKTVPSWWYYWVMFGWMETALDGSSQRILQYAFGWMAIRRGTKRKEGGTADSTWQLPFPLYSTLLCLPSAMIRRPHHRPRNSQVTMNWDFWKHSRNKTLIIFQVFSFLFLSSFLSLFNNRVSLYSYSWPGTCYVD